MIQEIKYNGHTASPSDYECADGDLATVIGAVLENGSLRPAFPPTEVLELATGDSVKYIHETVNFKHYIILKENGNLNWLDGEDTSETPTLLRTFTNDIHQVNAVGNTLLVLATDGMHYFMWKGDDDGYLYLGTEIPECALSFGLQGEMVKDDEFEITFTKFSIGEYLTNEFSDLHKSEITPQVLAKVNKFIAENSTNKGKFIYPFLLRYAYRLYDGTLTKHSAPILMIASSDLAPQVFWKDDDSDGPDKAIARLQIAGMLHTLDYAVVHSDELNSLLDWKDIVNSVDVFVSSPIYTYDQNGQCTRFVEVDDSDSFCVCKHTNQAESLSTTTYPLRYQLRYYSDLYAASFNPGTLIPPSMRLMLPRRSAEDIKSDIKSCSQFYTLESIKVEQLTTERTIIDVKEDYLQSLLTREVMTDDYDSHDKLVPQYSFTYNSRLNIANIKKVLFEGFDTNSLFNYSNGYIDWGLPNTPTVSDTTKSINIYIYIKQDGRDIVVHGNGGMLGAYSPILFFYYPNINAYKAIIVRSTYASFSNTYEVPLEKHNFLNGAFYFGGWDDLNSSVETTNTPTESEYAERVINIDNKIYTSDVNNPFTFPLLGINTVGTGKIYGICAAAKALSEGQFGQFPLYAFTSEGVWALEVSNTGSYIAKQPITRDVCINVNSITQIDSAVLFATNRGIMLISGAQTRCITNSINTQELFAITKLPKYEGLLSIYNSKASENEQLVADDIELLPFLEFIAECRMIYDYTHQRIIVYNPSVRYSYVYSFESQGWGMMLSDIDDNVNSYPEALAMSSKKVTDIGATSIVPILVDFSSVSESETATSLIVTRPFKLGDGNLFKTIDTIIQRGVFKSDHVQQVLYGSNDYYNWQTVWSSADKYMRGFRGTPYKIFRLAIICNLADNENLYGFTVQYSPRRLNQPR